MPLLRPGHLRQEVVHIAPGQHMDGTAGGFYNHGTLPEILFVKSLLLLTEKVLDVSFECVHVLLDAGVDEGERGDVLEVGNAHWTHRGLSICVTILLYS